jgi:hypothetical protein
LAIITIRLELGIADLILIPDLAVFRQDPRPRHI